MLQFKATGSKIQNILESGEKDFDVRLIKTIFFTLQKIISLLCLIAALIFSAGYYSAPIFFLLRRIKKCFALHFAAFSTFCVKSF